jgi:hypothetical protein
MAPPSPARDAVDTLEQGVITVLYRPRVGLTDARGLADVQRLYLRLQPEGQRWCRLLVIGRKKLPEPAEAGHARYWAFVDTARADPAQVASALGEYTYLTRTRGPRHQAGARMAGEGIYSIARHRDHTHLVYELRGPEELGRIQEDLHLRPSASYVMIARNPAAAVPPELEVPSESRVRLPAALRERFRGRRFAPADPQLLDHEGLDLILIAAAEDVDEAYFEGTKASAAEFMQ